MTFNILIDDQFLHISRHIRGFVSLEKQQLLFLRIFRKDEATLSKLSDEEVLQLFRLHQDPELIGELYTRYTHLVYGNCLQYLDDSELARDAVMQIFENLFEVLRKTEIRHFSSWLYQVSRNHCLMEIRKRKTRQKANIQLRLDGANDFVESAEEMHLNAEDEKFNHQHLSKAVASLKGEQRNCLELMYLEGKTYKQIVEQTGLEWNEVKSHIQNGKRKLRKILGPTLFVLVIIVLKNMIL